MGIQGPSKMFTWDKEDIQMDDSNPGDSAGPQRHGHNPYMGSKSDQGSEDADSGNSPGSTGMMVEVGMRHQQF